MTAIEQRVALLHAMHHHFGRHRIAVPRIQEYMATITNFPVDRTVIVIDSLIKEGLLNIVSGIMLFEVEISQSGIEYFTYPPPEPIPEKTENDYRHILSALYEAKSKSNLKSIYRKLAMEHHSDKGGDGELIKHIINVYHSLKKTF